MTKETKQKAKDIRERDENPAPEGQKNTTDPKDKTNSSAPDITADATALEAAKKA